MKFQILIFELKSHKLEKKDKVKLLVGKASV